MALFVKLITPKLPLLTTSHVTFWVTPELLTTPVPLTLRPPLKEIREKEDKE